MRTIEQQKELEKRIANQYIVINRDRIKEKEQLNAAENFLKSFPEGWTLDIVEYNKDYIVYGDLINLDDCKCEVLWSKTETFRKPRIVNKEKNYIIDVCIDNELAYLNPSSINYRFKSNYRNPKYLLKKLRSIEAIEKLKNNKF